jgi:hypothetical protein
LLSPIWLEFRPSNLYPRATWYILHPKWHV